MRRFISVDSETDLIAPGVLAPPLTCVSTAERINGVIAEGLFDYRDGVELVRQYLLDPAVVLVFHNGSYDLAVFCRENPALISLVFRALAERRIRDTQTAEQLLMIKRGDMGYEEVEDDADEENDDADGDDEDDGESKAWKRVKKNYGLAALSKRYRKIELDKGEDDEDGGARLTFGPLRGVPIEQWPEKHRTYAKGDATATLEIFEAQREGDCEALVSPDEGMQVAAAFALHLCATWGVRTDADALDALETKLNRIQDGLGIRLLRSGLLRPKREKGKVKLARNMKAIKGVVEAAYKSRGLPVPMTTPKNPKAIPQISTSKDTLEGAARFSYPEDVKVDDRSSWLAGHAVKAKDKEIPGLDLADFLERVQTDDTHAQALEPLVAYANCQKILGTYVKPMWLGVTMPMNSRPNVLVETGRTSWGAMTLKRPEGKIKLGTNLQNFPRMPGVRECIVARPGFLLASVDYESIELRTLAQSMLRICGRSTLAARYQSDPNYDPHTSFAARMLGITYAEAMARKKAEDKEVKKHRQLAKCPNFGYPGGMGPAKLVVYAWKNYGIKITEEDAKRLRDLWFAENPEMREYFEHVTNLVDRGGTFRQFGSGRIRGQCGFCDGCNGYFQGLAADGGKCALFSVSAECYADPESVLFGSRPLAFIHDEIIAEVPEAFGHECAMRIVAIMEREMRRFVPDVPVSAAPALMRSWLKAAEAAYDDAGRLIPWEDRKKK